METKKPSKFSGIFELFKNFGRVSALVWKGRPFLVLAIAAVAVLLSSIPFMQSGSLALLVNNLQASTASHVFSSSLIFIVIAFFLASILPSFLFELQDYITKIFYFYLSERFELLILHKLGDTDVAIHENPSYQDLFNKIREGGTYRIQNFAWRQVFIVQNLIEVAIASVVLAVSNWWLLLLIVVATVPELYVESRYGRDVWDIHGGKAEDRRHYWNLRSEFTNVSRAVELRLFQNIRNFVNRVYKLLHDFQTEQTRTERRKLTSSFFSLLFSQLAIGVAIVWFVQRVVEGELHIGTLTFILASIANFRSSLSSLFANFGRQYGDSLFVSDVLRFLNMPNLIKKPHPGRLLNVEKTPQISFENVTFRYPDTKEPVLHNISFTIEPGEKFAIVGVNGAGKTTLIKLLCRFYDPTDGRILIDGIDLKDIDLESWYHHLAVLFQDYAHYALPVRELIALGRSSLPEEFSVVKDAAQRSESHSFIESWEKGYDQMIGKEFSGGVEPSIGQWQKLALARAFYRQPNIFILDEPTASIDAEAEANIFERMEKLPADKTVILISHRFSTVRQANKICILENGTVSELGTHSELLANKGVYARLFTLQAKGYQ